VLGATYPEKLTLPSFVEVLEEGEDYSSSNSREAHPEALPLFLHFEKVEKDVH